MLFIANNSNNNNWKYVSRIIDLLQLQDPPKAIEENRDILLATIYAFLSGDFPTTSKAKTRLFTRDQALLNAILQEHSDKEIESVSYCRLHSAWQALRSYLKGYEDMVFDE